MAQLRVVRSQFNQSIVLAQELFSGRLRRDKCLEVSLAVIQPEGLLNDPSEATFPYDDVFCQDGEQRMQHLLKLGIFVLRETIQHFVDWTVIVLCEQFFCQVGPWVYGVDGFNEILLDDSLISARWLTHNFDDLRVLPDIVKINVDVVGVMIHSDVAMRIQVAMEDAERLPGRGEHPRSSAEDRVDT